MLRRQNLIISQNPRCFLPPPQKRKHHRYNSLRKEINMFDFRRPLTNSDNFLLRPVTKSKKGAERNLSLPLFPSRFLKPLAITEIKESETETCHRPILWGTRFDTKDLETKSSPSLFLFFFFFFFLQRCTRLRALKRRTSPPFWRVDEDLGKYLVSL